jgi:GT2 family glycosyltransferase
MCAGVAGDPRVAVVVLTHNRVAELLSTLERLSRLPERPRILVVDNGSSDGTHAAVADRFPGMRIVRSPRNLGAAGRTVGVRHVTEPYVALSDDDTWWEPGALGRAADLFDARPRLAVLTGRVLVGPVGREDPTCRLMAHSPLPTEPGMPGPSLLGFLAGASMVRRDAFLQVGGFEPRLFLGGEEELLAIDLAARGWWLCYVPDVVIHHHPSPIRNTRSRRSYLVRNALWSAWLRRPLWSALGQTLRVVRRAPRDGAALRGIAQALAGLPWVLRERRVVAPDLERRIRLVEIAR